MTGTNTNALLLILIVALLVSGCQGTSTARQEGAVDDKRPNIIIVLADDAGYADFGFMGSKDIKTPHLDQLAKDGVIFTDAHVSASVCSPSRAGLLTGRYQQRFGHECNLEEDSHGAFDGTETTIAEALKAVGYKTSIFGKWHLGDIPEKHPLRNGFDYFWGFLAGGRSYYPTKKYKAPQDPHKTMENYDFQDFDGYLTDVIGDKAVDFIRDSTAAHQPFFMYLSFNAPHTPMHAKKEVLTQMDENHARPVYAAMLWSMDEAVGNVMEELKRKGIYENTLIFFLSDNGGAHSNNSSVGDFKGWKGNQFEGGTRVPFTVTWKNQIGNKPAFEGLTSSLDIYKTAMVAAGILNSPGKPLDGTDLVPYLKGEKVGDPHEKLFWRKDQMSTIRNGDFKLIKLKDEQSVLYDLKTDLVEERDLSKSHPSIYDSLNTELNSWSSALMEPHWKEGESWNQVTRLIYKDLMNNQTPRAKDPSQLKELGLVSE